MFDEVIDFLLPPLWMFLSLSPLCVVPTLGNFYLRVNILYSLCIRIPFFLQKEKNQSQIGAPH